MGSYRGIGYYKSLSKHCKFTDIAANNHCPKQRRSLPGHDEQEGKGNAVRGYLPQGGVRSTSLGHIGSSEGAERENKASKRFPPVQTSIPLKQK